MPWVRINWSAREQEEFRTGHRSPSTGPLTLNRMACIKPFLKPDAPPPHFGDFINVGEAGTAGLKCSRACNRRLSDRRAFGRNCFLACEYFAAELIHSHRYLPYAVAASFQNRWAGKSCSSRLRKTLAWSSHSLIRNFLLFCISISCWT